jgi:hypothetical protein
MIKLVFDVDVQKIASVTPVHIHPGDCIGASANDGIFSHRLRSERTDKLLRPRQIDRRLGHNPYSHGPTIRLLRGVFNRFRLFVGRRIVLINHGRNCAFAVRMGRRGVVPGLEIVVEVDWSLVGIGLTNDARLRTE